MVELGEGEEEEILDIPTDELEDAIIDAPESRPSNLSRLKGKERPKINADR